ncbi:hypothetical protein [Bradyrhizobium sp. WSM1417]|uniref:hypothetical protein n=1 Tax=Bradyrhizobium sp. WSM1417 TaxID=754500 RepID=UPI000487BEEF|nr:hypothetical protein [Bradyrhizobium sp. WSM1417]
MPNIDELKAEVKESWRDSPLLQACLSIIDYLNKLPLDEMQMLTFSSFKEAVGEKDLTEDVVRAVALLANTSIHALDAKLLFIDDDDNEFELEKSDLADARHRGEFFHPETGIGIRDFESKIVPYFVPSQRFLDLKGR